MRGPRARSLENPCTGVIWRKVGAAPAVAYGDPRRGAGKSPVVMLRIGPPQGRVQESSMRLPRLAMLIALLALATPATAQTAPPPAPPPAQAPQPRPGP